MHITDKALQDSKVIVDKWVKHWHREGRLDGGLDKFARDDLETKIAVALSDGKFKLKTKKPANNNE